MQLAATRSRVGSGVGDLEAISEAMFTSTRVLASRHVGDSLPGTAALAWWRRTSRTNDGQMIKDPTAETGDQALDLLLRW